MSGADAIAVIILLTILIAIGVYLLHWLYRHSSKDQSFVRTGLGGERVVIGGGALIVPIVHNITPVNMTAMPVMVRRVGEQSLITQNKMRIDLVAEFFVRVIPTAAGVSTAARTLGDRTMRPDGLRDVVQSRFVDALSAVAATMTIEEIHADRAGYMRLVAELASRTLSANGLELENASLVSLNQSDLSYLNPDNAFDAEGLTNLTRQIEERRQLRNQIQNDTRVNIRLKDYEAEQRALEIDRDLEFARIEQNRSIEARRAMLVAEIEEERSRSRISVNASQVRAEEEAERVRIARDRALEESRINSATEIRNLEVERRNENELNEINLQRKLETQRIQSRHDIEAERIRNERAVREHEIASRRGISIAETESEAEIAEAGLKSEEDVESSRIRVSRILEVLGVEREREIRIAGEEAAAEQEKAVIARRHGVDMERLRRDQEIAEAEIAKRQSIRMAETASLRETEEAAIAADRTIEEMRIAARNFVERFEIEQRQMVEIVEKERLIAVINKSIEEAVARTEAAEAERAFAEREEQIASARAEEIASRGKRVELIEASSRVERETLRMTALARAEKEAAEQRAEADIAESKAIEIRYETDAAGHRKLNDAENARSQASRQSAIYENLVRNLPSIIRETVKPMERIESIKILQVDGLPGVNSPSETGGGGENGSGGNMTDRVVNSAMKYRTQVAFVDGLMKDLGLPVESLGSVGGMQFRNFGDQGKAEKEGES
jgi:uncharacterized membrane protein YqiK